MSHKLGKTPPQMPPYAFVPISQFQTPNMSMNTVPNLNVPITNYPQWQMPHRLWQIPTGPAIRTPAQKDPELQEVIRNLAPPVADSPVKKLRTSLTVSITPESQAPVRTEKQPDPWGLRESHEAKERQPQVVRNDETPTILSGGIGVPSEKGEAIVTEKPAAEMKDPLPTTQSSEPAPRSRGVSFSECKSEEAPETPTTANVRPAGLPRYVKLGLGAALALLAVIGLAVGLWLFGRGIYDNLEEM